MNADAQSSGEESTLVAVQSTFPDFMRGIEFAHLDKHQQPPDFIGNDPQGRNLGLELTRWLDGDQTKTSKDRAAFANDIMTVVKSEMHPRPRNFISVSIFPRWQESTEITRNHRTEVRREFYAAIREFDDKLGSLKARHWKPVPEGGQFDYEAHQGELKGYPTLIKYVSSMWFYQPSQFGGSEAGESWIGVKQEGPDFGLYEPKVAIEALRHVISKKFERYERSPQKGRLTAHKLDQIHLLVYTDPDLSCLNTPFQTSSQMLKSRVEGLLEAAGLATQGLGDLTKVFDGVFLYYSRWNSQWLARIWPSVQMLTAVVR